MKTLWVLHKYMALIKKWACVCYQSVDNCKWAVAVWDITWIQKGQDKDIEYNTEYNKKLKVICLWKLCGISNYKANVQQNLALEDQPVSHTICPTNKAKIKKKLSIHTTAVFHWKVLFMKWLYQPWLTAVMHI